MRKCFTYSSLFFIIILCSFSGNRDAVRKNPPVTVAQPAPYRLDASTAKINKESTEVVEDSRLSTKKGIALKPGIPAGIDGARTEPDIVFDVKLPKSGRYVMSTYAVTDAEGAELMKKAKTKFESLFMKIQIDDRRPTKRVVYVPWDQRNQETGKFEFSGESQQLKIWLPRGVRLEYIDLAAYIPPAVPPKALSYQPKVLPPATHPRLWVNQQSLPQVKAQLQVGENLAAWEKVKKAALTPFVFEFDPNAEMAFNPKLEGAVESKAFYYLMTGDKKIGKEAIRLTADYLSRVEFGNLLDITREMGRAIYAASQVYDWCYDLMTPEQKKVLYTNLMRLSDDMEAGWPPFKQSVINGHGNEAQICRDLLAMSIAVYNEDPKPYQYTSYIILEDLVPMRKFEYQSPRHNQGVNYGSYRFGWDMHSAWLFYRMTGKPVFDDNIKDVRYFWQYMRVPDGQMLRDGDGFTAGKPGEFFYWKSPQTMFLNYTYARDPLIKAEFERQGGIPNTPVLFLLLNDPALKAAPSTESMPLTKDFGKILGSMIARTGWDIGLNSNDVVAEIKGGGYLFGNHQHADAGSVQLYYRGFQFGDLGVYKFYGTPYDTGFNKRSVSHSMMLAVNPEAKGSDPSDGGTRPNRRFPKTAEEVQSDGGYNNGKVLSADFGPSQIKPSFSYFAADLTGAYASKMDAYTRGFCFLNLDRQDIPAAIILTDDMTTEGAGISKYWQINALNKPEQTADGVVLHNQRGELVGKTHVQMLVPASAERKIEILSGPDANSSFARKFEAPEVNLPEITGHRILISPKVPATRNRFLTVFQVTAGDTKPLPVEHYETPVSYVVILADRVVSMSNNTGLITKPFNLKVPETGTYQVVLAGMKAGTWNVKSADGKVNLKAEVADGKNTIFFKGAGGQYSITPGS
ncbi:MAG TPA: hypothetical protein VGD22_03150 [Sphingobacteriaceae bacterium]